MASAGFLLVLAIVTPAYAEFPKSAPAKPASVIIGVYVTHVYDLNPETARSPLASGRGPAPIARHPSAEYIGDLPGEGGKGRAHGLVEKAANLDQRYFRAVIRYSGTCASIRSNEYNLPIEFGEGIYDTNTLTYRGRHAAVGHRAGRHARALGDCAIPLEHPARCSSVNFGDPTLTKPMTSMASEKAVIEVERSTARFLSSS